MENYWEVSAIKYQGVSRPWKIWWYNSEVTEEPYYCLDQIDEEFLEHARNRCGDVILLNVTHLKETGTRFFVKTASFTNWRRVEKYQVLPSILDRFNGLPEEQRNIGVPLATASTTDLGCCPYAVVSMFPFLADYSERFENFNHGAVIGDFVHWFQRSTFGENQFLIDRAGSGNFHPLDILTDASREVGDKYLLLPNSQHAIGIEFVRRNNEVVAVMHCSLHPGEPLDLTLDNFVRCGGSLGYRGRMWRLRHVELLF